MNRTPRATRRALPDTAIVGAGRREPLWIHGSLAVRDESPLGEKMRRRRVEMVERDGKGDGEEQG